MLPFQYHLPLKEQEEAAGAKSIEYGGWLVIDFLVRNYETINDESAGALTCRKNSCPDCNTFLF